MHQLLTAILFALDATQVHAVLAPRATASRTAAMTQLIVKHSHAVDVDPVMVAAIVSIENPKLLPAARGGANVGIMQVHPSWLRRKDWKRQCGGDLTDAETNICFGVRVLRVHLAEHESLVNGLLAYNGCRSERCRGYATKVLSRRDAGRSAMSLKTEDQNPRSTD